MARETMWGDRPIRAARLSLLSISSLLIGSVLALFLNWAKLGTQGFSWGLLENCPICVAASRFIGPIAAVDTASKVAAIMVWLALILGLIGLAYFAQTRVTSTLETVLVAAGAFMLAFAPIVFVMLLPEAVPIHLDVGGYVALFFGVVSLIISTLGLRTETVAEGIAEGWLKDDDDATSRASEASGVATYGALPRV